MLNPIFFVVLKGNIPALYDVSNKVHKKIMKANDRLEAVFLCLIRLVA